MNYLQVTCLTILTSYVQVNGQTRQHAYNLTKHLFDSYDQRVRPTLNQGTPTKVIVDLTLLAINEMNEASETMKVTGYLVVKWIDAYLTWDSNDFGGLEYYLWPQSSLWKPDVSLRNSISNYKELGIPTLNVEVLYSGLVTWKPFEVFKSTCSFDITDFPFDVQNCSLDFIAWSCTKSEVVMSGDFGIDLEEYTPSSSWTLLNASWSTEESRKESMIKYTLILKRKPFFFILSIITPIVLLGILNLFVFALPCESGERAGFSVTVFLALAVFLTIVSDNLPKNSDNVSIFALYMVILTIQSTIITIVAMFTIRWSNNNETRSIPACMLYLTHVVRCARYNKVSESRETKVRKGDEDRLNRQKVIADKLNESPVSDGQDERDADEVPNEEKRHTYTWVEVVRALDVLLFALFFMIFSVTTLVCFIVCGVASK